MTEMTSHKWAAHMAVAGTCLIAFGAFWLSFTALADLAARSGIAVGQAWVWPLIVDGIIVVATVSVVALAGQKSAWYPWMLLAGGALISVTANAVHAVVSADADVPSLLAAAVAAVPPIVLLAITHLTVILTRRTGDIQPETQNIEARQVPEDAAKLTPIEHLPQITQPASVGEPSLAQPAEDIPSGTGRRERAKELREAGWSNKRIARYFGVHASTVGRWFARANPINTTESDMAGDTS